MTTPKITTSSLRNIRDLSKGETLDFLRKHINPNLKCIEDLGTGVDLCLAMNQLFPNSCDENKIRKCTNLSESDKRANFKHLGEAFKTLGINKKFPVELMMQHKFQSNFYFAQWFVRFFEANQKGDDNDAKNKMKFRKNIRGGATSRSPKSDDRSSGVITPIVAIPKIKRPPSRKDLPYGKSNGSFPVGLCLKERSSQTEERPSFEDKIDGLMETQRQLQRISMDQIEFIQKLQGENDILAESLEHSNLQKSYFHKKLDQIEELCEDCSPDSLRLSLKRILYEEGLPM